MSRHSRAVEEEAFSLFPFLAVLLCTMGTLALVFVVVAQRSSEASTDDRRAAIAFDSDAALGDDAQYGSIIDAKELEGAMSGGFGVKKEAVNSLDESAAETTTEFAQEDSTAYEEALLKTGAASLEDVVLEKESVEWFLEELNEIGKRNLETLDEKRARLANAEAGIAKLREESEVMKRRYDALTAENAETPDASELRRRVEELDREIEYLMEEASKLREENANAKKSYAIVPYQGKKGTFRRPIYVECRGDGVYIQPEGIRFDERDFILAQYPSNPFDVALRAAAQRYLVVGGQRNAKGEVVEPYPLIVVRPSGAKYFYSAIAALASWGELYGYEFVEEEQTLEYPTPDPVLAKNALEQANAARQRMEAQLATALSIRNAQIVASERMRANARHGGFGDDAVGGAGGTGAVASELQSRLGSNVRLGAAQPLAGKSRNDAQTSGTGTTSDLPQGALVAQNVDGGTTATGLNTPIRLATAPQGTLTALGGNFTGAADSVAAAAGVAKNMPSGGVNHDLTTPIVPYTGQYAKNRGEGVGDVATNHDATLAQGGASTNVANEGAEINGANAFAASNAGKNMNGNQASAENLIASGSASPTGTTSPNSMPAYMKDLVAAPDPTQRHDATQPRNIANTLGNTSYAVGANGEVSDGELVATTKDGNVSNESSGARNPFDKSVDLSQESERQRQALPEDAMPKEAFLVSRELTRTATRGSERGIIVQCASNGFLFPKQPGLRNAYTVPYETPGKTRAERDAELADVVTLCVKSWGLAGRNMYWAPYMKVEVGKGGDAGLAELREFCDAQGLPLLLADELANASQQSSTTSQLRR